MLFNKSFEFTPSILDSVSPYKLPSTGQQQQNDPAEITIGIHSRHIRPEHDGSDVSSETACLDLILESLRRTKGQASSCTIFLMSDRVATRETFPVGALARNCTTVVVTQEEAPPPVDGTTEEEHGPFRGAGMFRDFLVTSQAKDGFIHFDGRSSSAFVYERMVYNAMTQGLVDAPIARCEIDWRHGHNKTRLYEIGLD
jgi:hypothetical protein